MQGNLAEILLKMGRETALPGVELAIELLQELRADLMGGAKKAAARDFIDAEAVAVEPARRLGRPPGSGVKAAAGGKGGRGSWGSMNAEERSREMKRRMKVARERKRKAALRGAAPKEDMRGKTTNHPRHPDHPGHAVWVEKLKAAQRKIAAARSAA